MSELRAAGPRTDIPVVVEAIVEIDDDAMAGTLEEPEPDTGLETRQSLWALVFAGGIGTRFWPLSTSQRPKQLLALVNERPLIADTVARLSPLIPADRVLVVTSADIADALHKAIPEIPTANMLVEPRPLGTAAALAWGATEIAKRAGPDTVFVALHADLATGFPDVFRDTVRRAATVAASRELLVAIGAPPTRCETGFGYMQPGAPLDLMQGRKEGGAFRVEHFVEKPTATLADTLIDSGALWNTGVFVARARIVLEEIEAHTSELSHGMDALRSGDMARFAELVTSVSIDRGLFERTRNLAVMVGEFGWDDVGTWAALRRVRELDDTGNGVMGEAHCIDASGNVIHADGCRVVAYGISGMLVVSLQGLTFVTTLERATELGPLLGALPGSLRSNPLGT
jgi:mannose-1-phosphate guanylyltransferase